ncbi:unnamed protein product [Rangifer tarandus platyrhynchus]|uniref:Uncharacterized protein n=2 Tax=Rangifer tarandus platyrhynchus TaxID=3082113 RepID=A0ABN8ZC94_RANTA|nr:unnamed protein product [Rangifer tarandus platyrhynchus]
MSTVKLDSVGEADIVACLAEFATLPSPCPPQVGKAREQPPPPQTDPSTSLGPQAVELGMTATRLFTGPPSAPGGCLAHLAGPVLSSSSSCLPCAAFLFPPRPFVPLPLACFLKLACGAQGQTDYPFSSMNVPFN